MAAGEGKRMKSNIPKVLHLFHGVPMLVRIIRESLKLNPNKIIIITGKYDLLIKETIQEYIENTNFIQYVQQKEPLGTGHAIKSVLNHYNNNENVLILNGDMPLVSYDLLNNFITKGNNQILVANLINPYGYGRILHDNNGNFIGIKEEKDCTNNEKEIQLVNVGIYYFESTILKQFIPLIMNDNKQNEYYLTDIIKIIKKNSNIKIETSIISQKLTYQIMGVNTQEELRELENIYL